MSREKHLKQDVLLLKDPLNRAADLITQIQQIRKSKVLVFYCSQSISRQVAYKLNKILRKMGALEKLDLIIDSGGGDIDSAYKILKMLKCHAKQVNVIVPFFCKSAASLLALGADELIMCRGGELGPLDPQVRDPYTNMFIPALSIKEAITFIEDTKDPLVKLSLTDKIPVLLVGAYREAGESAKQYLQEIFSDVPEKEALVKTFTERFLSHGYPIDRDFLKQTQISVVEPDPKLESLIFDLYENYTDSIQGLYTLHPHLEEEILLLQTDNSLSLSLGPLDFSSELDSSEIESKPGSVPTATSKSKK